MQLDLGRVLIVPIRSAIGETIHRWKIQVVDKTILDEPLTIRGDGAVLEAMRDIHNRELTFQNANRPSQRYLCLRYIISYLNAKRLGTLDWVENLESNGFMWAFPGPTYDSLPFSC